MADRRVLDVLTGLDRAHHDFAGVDSDAHLQRRAAFDAQAIGVAPHLLLHPERGVERALRMVLMCDGAPNSANTPSPVDCTTWPP